MKNSTYHMLLTFVFIFSGLFGSQVVNAQSDMDSANTTPRTIAVSGNGTASGTPDIAYLQIGTEQTNSDPAAAFSSANDVISALQQAVVDLGVDATDIQTSAFNMWVQTNTDNSGNSTGESTYHAQNMLTICVRDVTQAGDIISAAVNAGANNINGLNFGIADPTALANQARDIAIADAQARAQQIASALGVNVGPAITVNESVSGGAQPLAARAFSAGVGGASVRQGQLSVNVQVTITFASDAQAT
ncbi:MAG: SIMPL domain-containing protein [Anaerolineae bacterium]|nr:SIMPL domain-containing protein [Anaerolineae bacterium]